MTKRQLVVRGVAVGVGWIAIHGGLVLLGGVFGVVLAIPFLPHSTNSQAAHCQEDEVAVHGGIDNWYDPNLPLECVPLDFFLPPVASSWGPMPPTATPTPSPVPTPTPTEGIPVALTFYGCPPFCGVMTNGEVVHHGAAACGYAFELGMHFTIDDNPTGRTYTCKDRGGGPYYWVDIFFADPASGWAWQEIVGTTGTIHLERSN